MKDSWAEYEDGGIALRNYFLERVSELAPIVMERLRTGLNCPDYHALWTFTRDWAKNSGVDTEWFRQSGEFTLQAWALGEEPKGLIELGGHPVPVIVTVYPQLQSSEAMLDQIHKASTTLGLRKAEIYQLESTKRHVDWLIRKDVLNEPVSSILRKKTAGEDTKFYSALRILRDRLGIPPKKRNGRT